MATHTAGSRSRKILGFMLLVLILALAFVWYIGAVGGNKRTVIPGRLYRSAQLTGAALRGELTKYGIKTVINLRGLSPDEAWYRDETAVCREMGVAHVDIALWASRLPEPEELDKLLDAYDHATYPVLIHCQGGSDRSGLAAAIYRIVYEGAPVDQAVHQELTWRYGHFRTKKARAMDEFFDLYSQTGAGMDFRQWIMKQYPAAYRKATGKQASTATWTLFNSRIMLQPTTHCLAWFCCVPGEGRPAA